MTTSEVCHVHELLPMQPVDTGGSIVGCHDGSEYLVCSGEGSGPRIRNLNVLGSDVPMALLVGAVLRLEPGTLLLASGSGRATVLEGVP